jgi:hypothetical protein
MPPRKTLKAVKPMSSLKVPSQWQSKSLRQNRPFVVTAGLLVLLLAWNLSAPLIAKVSESLALQAEARRQELVLPAQGVATGVRFDGAIASLVEAGVIDADKFNSVYSQRGGMPNWMHQQMTGNVVDGDEIVFSAETAPYLLNLLWPLGLANQTEFNKQSPVNDYRDNLAATGGWTLGQADSGGVYFNAHHILSLTTEQEDLVLRVAKSIYRPCCNNDTFFQDCNHGSAMLGLLMLAASQGFAEDEIYRLALVANSYWFPDQYSEIALYFAETQNTDWDAVDPKTVLSADYSSGTGWQQNVHIALQQREIIPAPPQGGGASCGV